MPEEESETTAQICPECGADLSDRNPYAHSLKHWPDKIPDYPETKLARERQKILREMAKKRGFM